MAIESVKDKQYNGPDVINALMLNFRELVIGLQNEGDQLRQKISNIKLKSRRVRSRINNLDHNNNNNNICYANSNTNTIINKTISASNSNRNAHSSTTSNTTTFSTHRTMTTVGATAAAATIKARGVLIVLEGLDRVGKSTLAQKLVEHLEKTRRNVTYCRFPDRTTQVGQLIDGFLKSNSKRIDNHVMHLLFSANRWELSKRIRSTLLQGTTVIVDRYSYSGIAYSSTEKDLSLKWCIELEKGLPRPDLVIYLNLPREAQYQRPGFGDERYETRERQELVRIQYERVMELSKETWLKVDINNKSPDHVLGEVILPVRRCLESCSTKELGNLDFFDPPS